MSGPEKQTFADWTRRLARRLAEYAQEPAGRTSLRYRRSVPRRVAVLM